MLSEEKNYSHITSQGPWLFSSEPTETARKFKFLRRSLDLSLFLSCWVCYPKDQGLASYPWEEMARDLLNKAHEESSEHQDKVLYQWGFSSVQFSSVSQSCPTLCNPMNRSTPGLPVHHQLLEFSQTYIHRVGDAIQPSHPLSSPSLPVPNPSQHQSLFQWVNSSHEVAKVLEFQL